MSPYLPPGQTRYVIHAFYTSEWDKGYGTKLITGFVCMFDKANPHPKGYQLSRCTNHKVKRDPVNPMMIVGLMNLARGWIRPRGGLSYTAWAAREGVEFMVVAKDSADEIRRIHKMLETDAIGAGLDPTIFYREGMI